MICRIYFMAAAVSCATPAAAQSLAWEAGYLLDGRVVFQGEGPVEQDGDAALRFWRPVQFGDPAKPVAGRMDCEVSAASATYSDFAFDLDARYASEKDQRERRRLSDDFTLRDYAENKRRLDVVGHRFEPRHEHYVLSLVAERVGDTLYDIRMNCIFVHGGGEGDPNYQQYVLRHTAISLVPPIPEPAPEAQS